MNVQSLKRFASHLFLVLFHCCLLGGCTRQVPGEIPYYEPNLVFRSGAVGIYISPKLQDYTCRISPVNKCSFNIYFCSFNTYVYPIGERIREILQTVTNSLFQDVYLYDSLDELERDYQAGRFQKIVSLKSIEGQVKISTIPESWRCYQPCLDLVPRGTPVVTCCWIKIVLASRKEKNGKVFTYPLEASGKETSNIPPLHCGEEYFAPAANQAFSKLASDYAQMISHIF